MTWAVIRFLHVLGAALWVGGQLTLTLVVLPPARRALAAEGRTELLRAVGRRFAVITMAVFLPIQVITGVLLAARHGVTWGSLWEPGYNRVLAAKLLLFTVVMIATAVHGITQAKGRSAWSRAATLVALVGSVGVVLLATGLVEGLAP
ncbi:hypothetical protein LX15_004671 [Streptoalloteichus tenebrarius]|uniref:Copper resistance protein D domain-containing protein n=1 Tax=Streptoalloteichus tenebrarius (strain ATCC 17920 / DSM 40477 / JCM 4838 / CBS 697.72 / NBRC 16177 / NCIMB 11028 / NRRL B-12390 / A12253. 1 / ISP 5477) TaxID=1933 RepID=A0ABT1HZL6_STRSD|nr:hypothetical protein [Streptoalloteichus tenebrarius]MCP2260951.1 hypothetical protein [Streptoalloteichus tenebrarius]BFE98887.1 hypothetical protein GCM10020241_05630 [Streptoalloteichus tenebrarius]